jgi:hypothetical protein
MTWGAHEARKGEKRNACRMLAGKREGKRSMEGKDVSGWITLRWVLEIIGWGGIDWIDLAKDRDKWRAVVTTVMNLPVP